MKKKTTIKEYNSMLQKYIDTKAYIKIFRTVCNEEENLSGFIIDMSKEFLLLQLDNEFVLDGYAIIKLDDFDSIRHSSFERTQRKIFNAEGILSSGYGLDQQLPLTGWAEILKALKARDIHVIIQNINKDSLDFWIGAITKVTPKTVSIHNYDPNGRLDEKSTKISLDTISIIKFGDRYSTTYRKYLKKKAK